MIVLSHKLGENEEATRIVTFENGLYRTGIFGSLRSQVPRALLLLIFTARLALKSKLHRRVLQN
jgi:hypothetical protein